jgi:ribose transport system permease protein
MQLSRNSLFLIAQFLMLFVLIVVASLVSPYFLSYRNFTNILRQASLIIIPAIGQAIVIINGGFDLSVGATLALSAVLTALLWKLGLPIGVAATIGVLSGVVVGLVNGLLISRVKLPPFVATYGMMFVLMGISMVLMGGDYIVGFPDSFVYLGTGYLGFGDAKLPMPFIAAVLLAILIDALMTKTILGRQIYAVGSNARAARLSGINVPNVQLIAFVLCGMIAAFGGLVVMGRMNAAEMRMGDDFLLPVVAAVILGGCSLAGGEGSVWGTFVGGLILTITLNVMTLTGVPDFWHRAISGIVIIVAVVLDQVIRRFIATRLDHSATPETKAVSGATAMGGR